jgi:acetyltransferase
MLHRNLLQPKSIVVIGGSDNIHSPGGSVLKNLIDHNFQGELFVVNPKKNQVQGLKSYQDISTIPEVDLAIVAIATKFIPETVKILTLQKNTKGFIIFSAGFSELNEKGAEIENEIVSLIDQVGGTLLGPNNIGLINKNYVGIFTKPVPKLNKKGVDFISGSGATAVFILEAAQNLGLTFSNIFSVGNSAQIGVEEILEYFDDTFDKKESSLVKILYIESIKNPLKFLKHSKSLIKKGCKIAAIKAGSSQEGNRAASSHTGAMANSDIFADSLLRKAGIIRCFSRSELVHVAGILLQKETKGKNIAIITHAGGPAVMLTDTLSKNGLNIPHLHGIKSDNLLEELYHGSSVSNPIDFLATGNALQLEKIIDYCENTFTEIDGMVVIFGSPGLKNVYDVYHVLDKKIKTCKKPIYAVLPSTVNVKNEISEFIDKGNIAFNDEVLFGEALAKVYNNSIPVDNSKANHSLNIKSIRKIIDNAKNGYLNPEKANAILALSGLDVIKEYEVKNEKELLHLIKHLKFPVAQKVVGPIHKSDVGGVILNVKGREELIKNFNRLMRIKGVSSVLIQPMITGIEIFIGAKKEGLYPHIIMCGLGGVFVEVLKDIKVEMVPVSKTNAQRMIKDLKAYPILKGVRWQKGINLERYTDFICKISDLVQIAPEISELDINPLLASEEEIVAVDMRIRIEK